MKSGTDYYVRMGATHSICQDYAIAGVTQDARAYAILSDGCSGTANPRHPGSPYTDYGSRFLVRAARCEIETGFNTDLVLNRAIAAVSALNLPPQESLDATLLVAEEVGDEIVVRMYGDGVILTRTREGIVSYTTVDFEQNAPYYLSYAIGQGTSNREALYRSVCTSKTTVHRRRVDGVWQEPLTETGPIGDVEQRRVYPKENFDLVLVCSDGVKSFTNATGEVPFEQVLDHMLTFKSLHGEFLTRRLKFFEKTCREQGWSHYDDLSVAGIYIP